MAVPANTVQRVTRTAVREDLHDKISILANEDFPFMSNIGSGTASNTYFEWLTDELAAADATNAVIDGDDVANDPYPAVTRLGNYVQTMDKTIGLSHITQQVNHAGSHTSMGAARAKKYRELKRDMEKRLCGNYAAVPPAAGTAHLTAGAVAFMRTNVSRGATGANATLSGTTSGYVNAAATNGTLRNFTEALLKDVHRQCRENGGKPDLLILSPALKQTFSTFTGVAANRHQVPSSKPGTIIGAMDLYVGDFGTVAAVDSIYTTGRDGLLIDRESWSIQYLQKFKNDKLAKTGHSDKEMVSVTFGLKCENDKASGVLADIQPA
ncbi:DUF5309 family protein [Croceicoccus sp. Ery15]|uniref:SU10 major capsid protein n=1 Tax=Croceicoccus sp. Ery15 TaxID=1703338 RepID=UPI001E365E42|nr:DUF5309 family protein [Croceicoccus sp. Ery15]